MNFSSVSPEYLPFSVDSEAEPLEIKYHWGANEARAPLVIKEFQEEMRHVAHRMARVDMVIRDAATGDERIKRRVNRALKRALIEAFANVGYDVVTVAQDRVQEKIPEHLSDPTVSTKSAESKKSGTKKPTTYKRADNRHPNNKRKNDDFFLLRHPDNGGSYDQKTAPPHKGKIVFPSDSRGALYIPHLDSRIPVELSAFNIHSIKGPVGKKIRDAFGEGWNDITNGNTDSPRARREQDIAKVDHIEASEDVGILFKNGRTPKTEAERIADSIAPRQHNRHVLAYQAHKEQRRKLDLKARKQKKSTQTLTAGNTLSRAKILAELALAGEHLTKWITAQTAANAAYPAYAEYKEPLRRLYPDIRPSDKVRSDRATRETSLLGRLLDAFERDYKRYFSPNRQKTMPALNGWAKLQRKADRKKEKLLASVRAVKHMIAEHQTAYNTKNGGVKKQLDHLGLEISNMDGRTSVALDSGNKKAHQVLGQKSQYQKTATPETAIAHFVGVKADLGIRSPLPSVQPRDDQAGWGPFTLSAASLTQNGISASYIPNHAVANAPSEQPVLH